jgi:hypothetical protein
MAVLNPVQLQRLNLPPRPPMPTVALVDPKTGKPTAAFVEWLARLDDWQRRLVAILGED